ncbi:MAG TPA: preprotein translocase subunit SecE [Candidatus Paceibacterota bacterium]
MAINKYINETKAELKHVTWPTRNQTVIYSVLVVAISLVVAAYLGLLDSAFGSVIRLILPSYN